MPQFVRPRTTPPEERIWLPAVRAILDGVGKWWWVWGWVGGGEVLFYFGDAAVGTDLQGVSLGLLGCSDGCNIPRLLVRKASLRYGAQCVFSAHMFMRIVKSRLGIGQDLI